MNTFPVVFSFGVPVIGADFVATVQTQGRLLLKEEDGDGWWAYGVDPSSIAGGGETKFEAWDKFRNLYHAVLVDIAEEATSFADFRKQVQLFFDEGSRSRLEEWEAATHEIAGQDQAELDLKVRKAKKIQYGVNVTEISLAPRNQQRSASDRNPLGADLVAAAA